jgi:primosomal protein N'
MHIFLSVIPIGRSFWNKTLTYSYDPEIDGAIVPGMLVEIPIKDIHELGVVIMYPDPKDILWYDEIRPIIKSIFPFPILSPLQCILMMSISAKYLIPLSKICTIFLPKNILKRIQKKWLSIKKIETKPLQSHRITHFLEKDISWSDIAALLTKKTIVICPDDFFLIYCKTHLWYRTDILWISGDDTETTKAQGWIDIFSWKYPIIFGNRKILFYNLSHYESIVYIEDAFWKTYFSYPTRIEYTDFLRIIADTASMQVHIFSSVPQLSTLFRFRDFPLHSHLPETPWLNPYPTTSRDFYDTSLASTESGESGTSYSVIHASL